MKNNETGEFELVMGNKQLLFGFFVVVVLFGVFFVMGYIVGRNSTPAGQLAANRDQSGGAAPAHARPGGAPGSAPPTQTPPKAAAGPTASEPQPATQPAQQTDTKPVSP